MSDQFNWIPILFVIGVWMVIVMATTLTSMTSENPIPEINDRCKPHESRYRYYLRFVFNPKTKKSFHFDRHQITLRIHDKMKNYQSTLTVRTVLLGGALRQRQADGKDLKVIVGKNEQIKDWGYVGLETSDNSSFHINRIVIMAIDSQQHYVVKVNQEIQSMSPAGQYDKNMFQCEKKPWDATSDEGRPPKQIQLYEMFIFFFMAVNLVMVLTAVVVNIWTQASERQLLVVIPLSVAVFVNYSQTFFLLFYRFYVRQQLWKSFGASHWQFVTDTFIHMALLIGVVTGVMAAFFLHYSETRVNNTLYIAVMEYLLFRIFFVALSWIVSCNLYQQIYTPKSDPT